MSKKFLALCAIAIGKSIIERGQPLPANVDDGKIKALLANGSIEPAIAEAVPATPPANETSEGTSDATATLIGVVTQEGRVVDLNKLKADELKELARGMEIAGADQMKKADLIAAITAVELKAEE